MKQVKIILVAFILALMSVGAVSLDIAVTPQEKRVSPGENYTLEVVVSADNESKARLELPSNWTSESRTTRKLSEGDKILLNTGEGYKNAWRLEFDVQVPEEAEGVFHPKVSLISKSEKSMVGGVGVLQQTVKVGRGKEESKGGESREDKGKKLEEAGAFVLNLLEEAADFLI